MENMATPYSPDELESPRMQANLAFLKELEARAQQHAVFDHPLLVRMSNGLYSPDFVRFFLAQFAKHIRVFTAALAALLGNSPDIKSRFVLFDNLFEEMGRGDYRQCHYMLYLRMLETLGIREADLAGLPHLYAVELLNDDLFQAVTRKPFVVGLTWLGLGGELTIPNNFPYMVKAIEQAFPDTDVDWQFFDRHGGRDQMHSDDANIVLAMYIEERDWPMIEMETMKSLTARKAVWDELESMARRGVDMHSSSLVA